MEIIKKILQKINSNKRLMAAPFIDHLEKQRIINIFRKKFDPKIFIETGTYLGDMINAQKENFERLYSIELSKKLFLKAQKRFENDEKISISHGDSAKVLNDILSNINALSLFWLDGHYSGGITAKGQKECPVIEELNIIFKNNKNHIILIDDARLFTGKYDYPTYEEVKDVVEHYDKDYIVKIESDIICISK